MNAQNSTSKYSKHQIKRSNNADPPKIYVSTQKIQKKNNESKNIAHESPYVHRYTAYLMDLKKYNWAYENSSRIPRARYC